MRAENGTQTRDPQLGRLVLYRLSYFRKINFKSELFSLTLYNPISWAVMDSNHRRLSQLSYSQPHLATLVTAHCLKNSVLFASANIQLFI